MQYSLPKLPYAYSALEPHIDAKTMEIHHTKHHQAYVDKLNAVMEKHPELEEKELEDIMKQFSSFTMDEKDRAMIRNHGGGHLNHAFFWTTMGPEKEVDRALVRDIESTWQSLEAFKKEFSEKAASHFGSGWMWLVRNQDGGLEMYSLPNQDSPFLKGHAPVIGLDVWEHAYYLKYQNRRVEYIKSWWNILTLLP